MGHGGTALIGVGVFVLFVVLILVIRRPVQRRLFAGTGWAEWQVTARSLRWRDRWTLYVATTLGRAAPARLAAPVAERVEALDAIHARNQARPALRRLWWVISAFGVLDLILTVLVLIDGGFDGWWRLISPLIIIGLGFGFRPLQRLEARMARRSLARTRDQLDA